MVRRLIMTIVAIILVVIGGYFVYGHRDSVPEIDPLATPSTVQLTILPSSRPTVSATPISNYTLAQVAQHSTKSNCWSAIDGKVYNLTNWISQHPGGEQQIIMICGKDGTKLFTNQHDHDKKQQDILKGFYIGNLLK